MGLKLGSMAVDGARSHELEPCSDFSGCRNMSLFEPWARAV